MKKITMYTKETAKTTNKAFEEFQQFNRVKDLSEYTIINYEGNYKAFTKYYDGKNLCSNLNLQAINDFIIKIKESGKLNNISINSHLTGLRVFINYCIKMGYTEPFKISLLKAEKKIKETYTDNELMLLLKKPDVKKCSFSEYRNWVFVNYLIATGNRVSTVINIKIGDIDFDSETIILRKTKNRNQQIIPISNSLKVILLDYLKYRKGNDEDYLFCNAIGEKATTTCVISAIYKYNHSRGVSKTSIHLFRHTFAKNWILNGRRYIQIAEDIRA